VGDRRRFGASRSPAERAFRPPDDLACDPVATGEPDYNSMPIGQLRQRVRQGDRGAVDYTRNAARKLDRHLEPLRRFAENPNAILHNPVADWERGEAALKTGLEGMQRVRDAKERAAVERERRLIAEVAAMRQAVERADGRADAAEGRESEALDVARRNFWVAVVAVVVAIVVPFVT